MHRSNSTPEHENKPPIRKLKIWDITRPGEDVHLIRPALTPLEQSRTDRVQ